MRLRRITMACLLALWLAAILIPAAALASGPSAGDQQYTDPLGGSGGSKSSSKGSGNSGNSGSSGSSTSSSSSGSSSSSSSSSASSSSSGSAVSSTSQAPVATTASSSTSTDPSSTSTLPRTGYDAWLAVGVGVVLLCAGMTVRLRARRVQAD